MRGVDHGELVDLVLVQQVLRVLDQRLGVGRLGLRAHVRVDHLRAVEGHAALEQAREVAVREDAGEPAVRVDDQRRARATRRAVHHEHGFLERRAARQQRQLLAAAHDVAHLRQATSQRTAGMEARVVLAREVAPLQHDHRQRVAHGEHGRGAGGGREVERAGLLHAADVEHARATTFIMRWKSPRCSIR